MDARCLLTDTNCIPWVSSFWSRTVLTRHACQLGPFRPPSIPPQSIIPAERKAVHVLWVQTCSDTCASVSERFPHEQGYKFNGHWPTQMCLIRNILVIPALLACFTTWWKRAAAWLGTWFICDVCAPLYLWLPPHHGGIKAGLQLHTYIHRDVNLTYDDSW